MTQFYHACMAAPFVAQNPAASAGIAPNYPDYYPPDAGLRICSSGFPSVAVGRSRPAWTDMLIGKRLREIRDARKLSQGDIEHRTGLIRCYISRVENGHTVPAVETLEKFARALEVPVYALFYDEEQSNPRRGKPSDSKDALALEQLRDVLARMPKHRRQLLMSLAQHMARGRTRR